MLSSFWLLLLVVAVVLLSSFLLFSLLFLLLLLQLFSSAFLFFLLVMFFLLLTLMLWFTVAGVIAIASSSSCSSASLVFAIPVGGGYEEKRLLESVSSELFFHGVLRGPWRHREGTNGRFDGKLSVRFVRRGHGTIAGYSAAIVPATGGRTVETRFLNQRQNVDNRKRREFDLSDTPEERREK